MNNLVDIPRPLATRILAHAQSSPEQEICGLVGARDGLPTSTYPVANVAATPDRLFRMDPAEQIEAMRRIREAGEELFAIYHSHPRADALPSATDLSEASYPEALYLIVSLNTRGVLEMRGYRLAGHSVQEVDLELSDE